MAERCEICGLRYDEWSYHDRVVEILKLIQEGYMPAMLDWTGLNLPVDGVQLIADRDDEAIWADRFVLEDSWTKESFSFSLWRSKIDRIRRGEPVWMVASEGSLADSYLRWILDLYPTQDRSDLANELEIDLKRPLWSAYFTTWSDYAPSVFDAMRVRLDTEGSVFVRSSPSDNARYGEVRITHGDKKYKAEVSFFSNWEEAYVLGSRYTDAQELNEASFDAFAEFLQEILPSTPNGTGIQINRVVKAGSFEGIMQAIDVVEDLLIERDEMEVQGIDRLAREWLEERLSG